MGGGDDQGADTICPFRFSDLPLPLMVTQKVDCKCVRLKFSWFLPKLNWMKACKIYSWKIEKKYLKSIFGLLNQSSKIYSGKIDL